MACECHILQNPCRRVQEKAAAYSAVTPGRIQEIAREIFTADRLVLTVKTKKEVRGLLKRL